MEAVSVAHVNMSNRKRLLKWLPHCTAFFSHPETYVSPDGTCVMVLRVRVIYDDAFGVHISITVQHIETADDGAVISCLYGQVANLAGATCASSCIVDWLVTRGIKWRRIIVKVTKDVSPRKIFRSLQSLRKLLVTCETHKVVLTKFQRSEIQTLQKVSSPWTGLQNNNPCYTVVHVNM